MTITCTDDAKPLDLKDIETVEQAQGVMPSDIKSYFTTHPVGMLEKPLIIGPNDEEEIAHFLNSGHTLGPAFVAENTKMAGHRWPAGLIAFGSDRGGNYVLISVRAADFGHVYFWDMELESEAEPPTENNLTLLANSFTEFLSQLRPYNS